MKWGKMEYCGAGVIYREKITIIGKRRK